MAVLPAQTIRALCVHPETGETFANALIQPFQERQALNGMTSGLGPCTYDFRIKQGFILMPLWMLPLYACMRAISWLSARVGYNVMWQNHRCAFALASTIERVAFPNDICGVVLDKSSWARQGLAVQNTKFDPGFEGHPTLELSNHGLRTLRIAANAPICQFKFERLEAPTEMPYTGRYQGQGDEPTPYKPAKDMWG